MVRITRSHDARTGVNRRVGRATPKEATRGPQPARPRPTRAVVPRPRKVRRSIIGQDWLAHHAWSNPGANANEGPDRMTGPLERRLVDDPCSAARRRADNRKASVVELDPREAVFHLHLELEELAGGVVVPQVELEH